MDINQFWKLADQLSVHEASCLIIGVDPEKTDGLFVWGDDYSRINGNFANSPLGYLATRQALLAGLRSNVIDGIYYQDQDMNGNEWLDISKCYVLVGSLIEWLKGKGINNGFFFSEKSEQLEYLNKNHPHYSAKLAASIAAWQAISSDPKYQNNGKTIKQNLINWLTSHAAEFNLIKEDGEINNNAIENQVAVVANWDTFGGAPKTSL